jgi:phage terminase small subunit
MGTELTAITTSATLPAFGGLTLKQSKFLDNFLTNPDTLGNGTKSVIAAGYTDDKDCAAVIASQLLRSPKVKQEIKRRLGKAVASGEEVLELLTKHARADLTDILTPSGEFDYQRARRKRLLKKLKIKTTTDKDGSVRVEQEFEIHDPQAALEKLGRFHKLFTDRVETTDGPGDPARLAGDLTAVLGVVREAIEAYRVATQAQGQVVQVVQGATESGGPSGPSLSSAIIDVTPRMDQQQQQQQQQQLGPVDHARSSPSPLSSSQPIINPTPTRNGEDGP